MILKQLNIVNWKNIRDAELVFSDKFNCFVGLNGQGKTNVLDAIYLLSFTKSAFSVIDSQNITHGEEMALIQGRYEEDIKVSCGLKRGIKKQFRLGDKEYKRMLDHIGLIPLVLISPEDSALIGEGSDERRRFMDVVIGQQDKMYLQTLAQYNGLLKQRNALLKQLADNAQEDTSLLEVFEAQMVPLAEDIYAARCRFIEAFVPHFQSIYETISGGQERVSLRYVSQLQDRELEEALVRTRSRDLILGWTSQGVHKDDIEMTLDGYPLKRVGSQGQQKTYVMAMKLAQATYLIEGARATGHEQTPILLLDDIFDKLDAERVERILSLVRSERFGQIFVTDTNRQYVSRLIKDEEDTARIFLVENGVISSRYAHHWA